MRLLESERLLIKPVEQDDLPFLLDLRWDEDVTRFLIHDPISMKDQLNWFNNRKASSLALSIFLKEERGNAIIGTGGLDEINHRHQRATFKFRIHPSYQGKGYAKEGMRMILDYGFNTLNLNKIYSDSLLDNIAVLTLIKKLGFKQEGILAEHYFHKGAFRDTMQCALFRRDFNTPLRDDSSR